MSLNVKARSTLLMWKVIHLLSHLLCLSCGIWNLQTDPIIYKVLCGLLHLYISLRCSTNAWTRPNRISLEEWISTPQTFWFESRESLGNHCTVSHCLSPCFYRIVISVPKCFLVLLNLGKKSVCGSPDATDYLLVIYSLVRPRKIYALFFAVLIFECYPDNRSNPELHTCWPGCSVTKFYLWSLPGI